MEHLYSSVLVAHVYSMTHYTEELLHRVPLTPVSTSAWHIKLTVSLGYWGAHLCSPPTQLGLPSSTPNHPLPSP